MYLYGLPTQSSLIDWKLQIGQIITLSALSQITSLHSQKNTAMCMRKMLIFQPRSRFGISQSHELNQISECNFS